MEIKQIGEVFLQQIAFKQIVNTNSQTLFMNKYLLFNCLLLLNGALMSQTSGKTNFKVMCYNVENYFDTEDDSLKKDEEYLPTGMRAWNYKKYQKKQANIAKVITAIGGWDAPALVGLCEVESKKGLVDLTQHSGLKNLKYKFIHHESPDARGVDVALLYQPNQFKPIHNKAIKISFPGLPNNTTRDVLYVCGKTPTADSLHVFVCHFPSRLGGELESEARRCFVASVIRTKVDSIFAQNKNANIMIMGDFNDFPTNKSIHEVLNAKKTEGKIENGTLYNPLFNLHGSGKGTNKHNGEWGVLDQIIVSGSLLNPLNKINGKSSDAHIFDADFLLEPDEQSFGKQPFRTYVGMKYHDGFSDHLPVYFDLWY